MAHPSHRQAIGPSIPFLFDGEEVPVQRAEDAESQQKEQQLAVDELVQGPLPHEEEAGEAPRGGRRHLILVTDRHAAWLKRRGLLHATRYPARRGLVESCHRRGLPPGGSPAHPPPLSTWSISLRPLLHPPPTK